MDISQVKYNLGKIVRVTMPRHYVDADYLLTGCIIRRNDSGKFFYQAEVQDIKSKSLLIVGLENVERKAEE